MPEIPLLGGGCNNSSRAVFGNGFGYTAHGINQAIGRDDGRGMSSRAILDTLRNPIEKIPQSNGLIKIVGDNATIIVNSTNKIITFYGQPRVRE